MGSCYPYMTSSKLCFVKYGGYERRLVKQVPASDGEYSDFCDDDDELGDLPDLKPSSSEASKTSLTSMRSSASGSEIGFSRRQRSKSRVRIRRGRTQRKPPDRSKAPSPRPNPRQTEEIRLEDLLSPISPNHELPDLINRRRSKSRIRSRGRSMGEKAHLMITYRSSAPSRRIEHRSIRFLLSDLDSSSLEHDHLDSPNQCDVNVGSQVDEDEAKFQRQLTLLRSNSF
mmetsp:Transcript_12909/g.26170  ORF Transcript_12909/g.26170 Transcript_12909/m.26170 type:complete len:228 (+) Transcript_12909:2237-2920(+)